MKKKNNSIYFLHHLIDIYWHGNQVLYILKNDRESHSSFLRFFTLPAQAFTLIFCFVVFRLINLLNVSVKSFYSYWYLSNIAFWQVSANIPSVCIGFFESMLIQPSSFLVQVYLMYLLQLLWELLVCLQSSHCTVWNKSSP